MANMLSLNIKFLMKCIGVAAITFILAACGGGGSSSSAASTGTTAAPSATDSAIDPATGSVAAAEVTCQGACVSLSADAGTSTE